MCSSPAPHCSGLAQLWRRSADPNGESREQGRLWIWGVIVGAILAWELISFVSPPTGRASDVQLHDRRAAGRACGALAVLRWMGRVRLGARDMTSRAATFVVWGALAVALLVATQVFAVTTRRIPTVGALIRALVRRPGVRVVLLAGWLWLGWHFFVRSSR